MGEIEEFRRKNYVMELTYIDADNGRVTTGWLRAVFKEHETIGICSLSRKMTGW